jgi:hypothetical protein
METPETAIIVPVLTPDPFEPGPTSHHTASA